MPVSTTRGSWAKRRNAMAWPSSWTRIATNDTAIHSNT